MSRFAAAVASETAGPAASSGTLLTNAAKISGAARRGFHVTRQRFTREHDFAIEALSTQYVPVLARICPRGAIVTNGASVPSRPNTGNAASNAGKSAARRVRAAS